MTTKKELIWVWDYRDKNGPRHGHFEVPKKKGVKRKGTWSTSSPKRVKRRTATAKALKRKSCKRK